MTLLQRLVALFIYILKTINPFFIASKRSKPDSTSGMANKSKVNEQTQTSSGCNDSNGSKKCKEKMRKCKFIGLTDVLQIDF